VREDLLPGAKAAAEFLGLSPSVIYRLADEGRLPTVRLGARMYFRKSELERVFSSEPQSAEVSL
jgi:excisionase family DNA binding protein